jgi:hypothetical protein
MESIVVLEEGSFESNAVVQIDCPLTWEGPEANTIYEDCGQATLTFETPWSIPLEIQEMVLHQLRNREATNGVTTAATAGRIRFCHCPIRWCLNRS